MSEQQLDFKKIQKMIGKCTPEQLGSLMKQYSERYLTGVDKPADKEYTDDVLKIFDGSVYEPNRPALFTQTI